MASLSARRAWIEILYGCVRTRTQLRSLSARRAWIEIPVTAYCAYLPMVALRKESVDRNANTAAPLDFFPTSLSARRAWIEIFRRAQRSRCQNVALRKESVDRNDAVGANNHKRRVALRKESVDRNSDVEWKIVATYKSLSARRAWIEILGVRGFRQ